MGLLCVVALLFWSGDLVAAEETNDASGTITEASNKLDATIRVLISKLGADNYQDRRAAEQRLESIGASARAQLKDATGSDDPEISARAGRLLTKLKTSEKKEEPKTRVYVVGENEDLYSTALLWNVSVQRLKEINDLQGTRLAPGQKIKIPIE